MTAMTVSSISEYRNRLAGLPIDRFCGSLLWYSISGRVEREGMVKSRLAVQATTDQFHAWFDELGFEALGLDRRHLPPLINRINAFRKASSQVRCDYELDENRSVRFRVEEIDATDEFVLRHIMRDITDRKGQVQVSAHVGTLKFFRGGRDAKGRRIGGESVKTTVKKLIKEVGFDGTETGRKFILEDVDTAKVRAFIKEIDRRYLDASVHLDSNGIRAVVRGFVTSLNAIPCSPSGSLYFVHMTRQPALDAIQEFVRRIGQGCQFVQVPLLDNPETRDMLTDAFQTAVEDECYSLLTEIREFNENVKTKNLRITPHRYQMIKARLDKIMARSEEYSEKLGLAQGRSAAALEMALEGVFDISERIEP